MKDDAPMNLYRLLAMIESAPHGSEALDVAIQRLVAGRDAPAPPYTRSLDAAMTLITEGWTIHRLGQLSDCRSGRGGWFADLYRPASAIMPYPSGGTAQTAALAVCGAVLRMCCDIETRRSPPPQRRMSL